MVHIMRDNSLVIRLNGADLSLLSKVFTLLPCASPLPPFIGREFGTLIELCLVPFSSPFFGVYLKGSFLEKSFSPHFFSMYAE